MGLSQTDVARLLNTTRQAYNHYETGRREPTLDTLVRLAEILHTSTDFLMGRTEKKAPDPEQPASEDEIQNQAARLYNALLAAGYIKEGQELTSRQMDALESFGDILALLFDSDDK